jgi:hypothetical protein
VGEAVKIFALAFVCGCTTHVLASADQASLRDSLELDGRIYLGIDGGVLRAYARAAYCSDRAVLERSDVAPDASVIQCGVAK